MKNMEETLLSLGQKRDYKKLETFIDSQDTKQLCSLVSHKICYPEVTQLLNYIFRGLSNSGPSQMKRLKITEHILNELRTRELGDNQLSAIICRISLEIDKFSSAHVIKLTEWCLECIQTVEGDQMSWKELLPKLLNNLESVEKVDHSGTEMTGAEYKSQVISTLCMAKWKPDVVISLAGMFAEVPLSPDEHLQVVYKLCKSMDVMDPTGIPPFVKQLLHLCKNQLGLPLFLQLQQYFTAKLHSQPIVDAASADLLADAIDSDNHAEIRRSESTVMFFINQSASLGHANVRDLIKSLKSVNTAPEFVLNPFFLSVLLSVSSISTFEEQIFEVLKQTITRTIVEEERRSRSAWIQNLTPPTCDVGKTLTYVIDTCGQEREMIKAGLVNVGFVFLNTAAWGKEASTEKIWSYGRLLLISLVKKHHHVGSTVLQTLCNRILIGQGVTQYTECLLKLSQTVPLLMNECQNILIQLLEQVLQLPGHVGQEIVRSLLPLMQTFPSLRDALILILRKALFRCNVSIRQMAVMGFLLLLKTLDVKNFGAMSQCSQSSSTMHSYSSQIHSQVSDSSEAISFELLNVLRRCFVQQAEVRFCLYQGLYEAICRNPSLYPHALSMLLDHFNQFYKPGDDTLPPLDFSKTVVLKGAEAVLQEPLAQLVFVLQQVVTKASSISQTISTKTVTTLEETLNSVTDRMIKCTLEDFGLDNTINLSDNVPESQQMYQMFLQMLGVYEVLMCYTVARWTKDSTDSYQMMVNLFKGYSKLIEFSKMNNKNVKKVEGEGGRGQKKKKAEPGSKGKPSLRIIPTVLDLKSTIKILQLLYRRDLSWASAESATMLKGRREFSRYIMQATLQQLQHIKAMKNSDVKHIPHMFGQCVQLGSILYQDCVGNFEDLSALDKLTSVLSVECFLELLSVINLHYKSRFLHFVESIAEVPRDRSLEALTKKFEARLEESMVVDEDEEDDPGCKKLPLLLVNVLTLLIVEVPMNSSQVENYNWVKTFALEKTPPNPSVAKGVMSLLFKLQIQYKPDGTLFDNVALQLLNMIGPIDTENRPEKAPIEYACITENTQNACLQQLCGAIKSMLDDIDWVVARLRGEFCARAYPSEHSMEKKRELLKVKERDLCRHLSHCVKIGTVIICTALPSGPTADAVLKLLVNIYATLSGLTKYFILRSSRNDPAFQAARFTSVIELAGVELASQVQWLILHIVSDSENKMEEDKKKKKKGDRSQISKVLKDSKCIPKLVFGMELFEKFVIQLSKKVKVNLMERVKPSTSRDFRIKMEVLEQALVNQDENDSGEDNAEENDIEQNETEENQTENSQPSKKKQRTK